MNCADPIDTALLADYWIAALPSADEEAIEEHLFACDACGERLARLIQLAEGVRKLAAQGSLRMIVTSAYLDEFRNAGRKVREYAPPAGGATSCTVTAADDLLIARLSANLSGAARIDLSICNQDRVELDRLTDIPVNAATGAILYQENIDFAKAAPVNTMIARLVTYDHAGRENLLGEYTFNHSPS